MDRSLLERMIGASVLVLVMVLVVPSLLNGRKQADTETALTIIDAPDQVATIRVETIRLTPPPTKVPDPVPATQLLAPPIRTKETAADPVAVPKAAVAAPA